MNEDRSNRKRRTVLKSLGIGAAGLAGISTGAMGQSKEGPQSREEADRLFMAARKVGNARGQEARAQFLRNHGVPTAIKSVKFAFPDEKPRKGPKGGDDEVSTQKVDCVEPDKCDGDIDLTLSLSYNLYQGEYYASLAMRMRYLYEYSSGYYYMLSGGEDPDDGFGIQWEQDHWKVSNRDDIPASTSGDDHIEWDNGSWNKQGVAFRVDDYNLCASSGPTNNSYEWTPYEYGGVYLRLGDEYSSGDDITASYLHTWKGTTYSFGVSYPFGISVSSGTNVRSEDLQTDLNGKTLRVTEYDA